MEKLTLKQKLFALQNEVGKIGKDSNNPFFKSKYFDVNSLIEHLSPYLEKNRLLLLQPIKNDAVFSEIHDIDSEDFEFSSISLTDIKDPQKRGSEITYYRRYTLASLLGLQATDDDANLASGKVKEAKQTKKKWLNPKTKEWDNAVQKKVSIEQVKQFYSISKDNETLYLSLI